MNDLIILLDSCDLYFMLQSFCLISRTLFDRFYFILGMLVQYDTMGDLVILAGHCDLYFMVQLFCFIIFPTLFNGFTSYLRCWFNMPL